jgi:Protein of unknown function (DUF3060)
MKTSIIIALVLASASAFADKNLEEEGTWDCKKDPVVLIATGGGKYNFKGACTKITIAGGDNTLTVETLDLLEVPGGGNTITVATVGTIFVAGSENKITWKKAKTGSKPVIKGQPELNTVKQGK